MYDPTTSETDTEYLELFNQGNSSVDIGGWMINTTSIQAIIPIGTIIKANSYFLIADEDDNGVWSTSWPTPDYSEEEITLSNTDSGVQILDSNNNLIDVVGWGSAPLDLYEGTAHQGVQSGECLTRIKINDTFIDTDDNSVDFIAAAPNPKNSNQQDDEATVINLYASVTGSAPRIDFFNISPDESADQGNQIYPSPGKNKTIA